MNIFSENPDFLFKIDVAWIDGDAVFSLYTQTTNEKVEVVFNDIPVGEHYIVVFEAQLIIYEMIKVN